MAILSRYANVATPNDQHILSVIYDIETGGAGLTGPMTTPAHLQYLLGIVPNQGLACLERLRLLRIVALHPDGCYRLTVAGLWMAKVDLALFADSVDAALGQNPP